MAKIGRNDPCPCGSGKKYKKCCLAKDEAAARLGIDRGVAEPVPVSPAWPPATQSPVPAFPDRANEVMRRPSPEDLAADERWERFESAASDGRVELFRQALADGVLDADEALDMLDVIREACASREERESWDRLVAEMKSQNPALYDERFAAYADELIQDAIEQDELARLPELLEPFALAPTKDLDTFAAIERQFIYHGQTRLVLDVARRAWPAIQSSEGIFHWVIQEQADLTAMLVLFDYVESTPSPSAEDPGLDEAFADLPDFDLPHLRRFFACLIGADPQPLSLADLVSGTTKEARHENVQHLSLEWLGDLHRRHGVPYAKGELARITLAQFLVESADKGVTGSKLLLPNPDALRAYIKGDIDDRFFAAYEPGVFLELLPHYLSFLVERGLVEAGHARQAFSKLDNVQKAVRRDLKRVKDGDLMIEAIEQAWVKARDVAAPNTSR